MKIKDNLFTLSSLDAVGDIRDAADKAYELLSEYDGFGSCEVGIRLLPRYGKCGYGREALSTVIDYALYKLGMSCVKAKCLKENTPSQRMLSAVMTKDAEDEKYFRFIACF